MHSEYNPFPLRLPNSLREQAAELAKSEGISLNGLITIALAEKLARVGQTALIAEASKLSTASIRPESSFLRSVTNPPHLRAVK